MLIAKKDPFSFFFSFSILVKTRTRTKRASLFRGGLKGSKEERQGGLVNSIFLIKLP